MLSPYLAGPVRFKSSATNNEAALLTFHSQGAWMEALRTHNLGVRRAFHELRLRHHNKIHEEKS